MRFVMMVVVVVGGMRIRTSRSRVLFHSRSTWNRFTQRGHKLLTFGCTAGCDASRAA